MKINDKETKFNIGDTVYYVEGINNSVVSSKVYIIIISDEPVPDYEMQDGSVRNEKQLYTTKEEAEEKIKKRKFKVYLSGAIANDKNYITKFMNAKREVLDRGYSVLNPIETYESIHDKGVKECMFAAIELLRHADIMLLLDKDLTKSRGVQIELELARYGNIPIADDYKDIDYFYDKKYK